MTRLAGSSLTESQTPVIRVASLVQLGITGGTGTYNFTDFDSDLTVGSVTYKPAAFSLSSIEERDDSTTTMRRVTLGLGEQDLATVLNDPPNYVWKSMKIIDAMVQDDGTVLTTGTWVGFMTSRSISQGDGSGAIQITGQDWFSILGKTGTVRFDSVSQKQRAPSIDVAGDADTFFDNMPGLKGQHITWMGKTHGSTGGRDPRPMPGGGGAGNHPHRQF